MKSKKKLLLLGVGAMGALAMGVGATSTFAWYQAQQSATIDSASSMGYTIGTTKTSVTVNNISLPISLIPANDGAKSNPVQLSYQGKLSGEGADQIYVNTAYVGGTGTASKWAAADGTPTAVVVNTFTASADASAFNDQEKAAVAGRTFKFSVGTAGQVVLATQTGAVETNAVKVVVVFNASGAVSSTTIEVNGSTGTGYYAVRTNNVNGLEYVKASGIGSDMSSNVIGVASGNAADDTKGYDSTSNIIKSCTSNTWTALSPEVYLHEADALTCNNADVQAESV